MAVDPKKLIAALVPDVYCKKDKRGEVKSYLKEALEKKEPDAYLRAAELAELAETDFMDFDQLVATPFKMVGLKNPVEQHSAEFDSSSQAIEQIYFYLHDYLYNQAEYGTGEKIVDNFISAPGSAHFSEMGMKATKMQEEGMKILGVANQLVRSILNIIYDLKEMKLRLEIYNDYNKGDKLKKEASFLSLKQIWLDQVDAKRGPTSIKGLVASGQGQPNFVTLIDGFMAAKELDEIKKMDLNERVQRLLLQRFSEFERWVKESDKELHKRYEIEKVYLKSQLNSVKLYSRWAKPYLKAAVQLEQRGKSTSALVTAFNTSLFELTLLGVGEYKSDLDIDLPKSFKGANRRKYAPVILVEMKFRSIPERHQQGYGFRGKAEVKFTSFSLNEDERRILKEQLEWDDFKDVYQIIGASTEESIEILQGDINYFLEEESKEVVSKEKSFMQEDTNAFAALFSVFKDLSSLFKKSEPRKDKKEKSLKINPDSDIEKVLRSQAGITARMKCRKFYDNFKRLNQSPTF